jgi:hypothetical protein
MPAIRWLSPAAIVAVALAFVTAAANAASLLFFDHFALLIILGMGLGTFAGTGLVVALLRPRHAIGWLFLVTGATTAVSFFLSYYVWQTIIGAPGSLPAGELAASLWLVLGKVGIGAMLVAIFLFPTGRPQSRGWAWLLAAVVASLALSALVEVLRPTALLLPAPGGVLHYPTMPNPLAVSGGLGELLIAIRPFTNAVAAPVFLLAGASVVARFRGSSGIERLQLKWFAYAVSVGAVLLAFAFILPSQELRNLAWAGGVAVGALVPVAAGIAVLRYRLYEIDLLIKRTAVYGATTAAVAATFWIGILALQRLLSPLTSGSELAIAASTLVSLALFQPIRRRIQDALDRRFDRSRYDAARTLEAFAERLRDEVDLDALRNELVGSVRQTMAPAHTSLWLRESPR